MACSMEGGCFRVTKSGFPIVEIIKARSSKCVDRGRQREGAATQLHLINPTCHTLAYTTANLLSSQTLVLVHLLVHLYVYLYLFLY